MEFFLFGAASEDRENLVIQSRRTSDGLPTVLCLVNICSQALVLFEDFTCLKSAGLVNIPYQDAGGAISWRLNAFAGAGRE